ncbi:Uncharacterized protein APZ42_003372 [Daphnia magna]|uniref:Uncharacterized protein n=1 Tax=Daphnia magna TaxID=35525 RepID=A0A164HKR1_9CRUS|nr:Uncharacterized protein APZ42_003372 [Daphnia magna]
MFLTAPLTAFKHDSEAAGFWHSHNFQRCQLAAFPFAAPQTTTNSLFPACFFFASTRQPPISTVHRLRSLLQPQRNHHQFIVSNSFIVYGPTSFTDCSFLVHPSDSHQCIVFLTGLFVLIPFAEPKQTTSSLLFTALLPAVHHPSQTALFFALIRQPPIFKGMLAAFPFAAHKQPPTQVSHSYTDCVQKSFRGCCFWHSHKFPRCLLAAFPFAAPPNNRQLIISSLLFFLHPPVSHQFQRSIDCVPFCSPKATINSLFLIASLSTVKHPLQTGLFRIHLTATNCNGRDV